MSINCRAPARDTYELVHKKGHQNLPAKFTALLYTHTGDCGMHSEELVRSVTATRLTGLNETGADRQLQRQ